MKKSVYEFMIKVLRAGNRAVEKAQEGDRRLGLPNVFVRNGKIYYELPDGTITREDPFKHEE